MTGKIIVGCRVKRLSGSHGGMKSGDIGTVVKVFDTTIIIKEYNNGNITPTYHHEKDRFEVVDSSWKERYGGE